MLFTKKKEMVGIDIGSSSIKLIQLKELKSGGYQLLNVGVLPLPPEAIVDNTLMDNASIVEAIRSIIGSLNVNATDAVCSISGNSVIIRKISLPAMSSEELEDQIQWEAEQYIPFDINDVNVDFQILSAEDVESGKMSTLLVASKKDIINDYVAVFNEAGLPLSIVDVDAFAMQNAFELNYEVSPGEVVALINIGASMMNLNVIRDGMTLFTRDVQVGGNLYTEEIQKQFGLSSVEAEQLKISGEGKDKEKLAGLVDKLNENIALETRRSLDFYNSTAGEDKITHVYMSGGAAKIKGLVTAVSQKLGLDTEIINPFRKIICNEKEFDSEYLYELGPLVTVAVGLATRRLGDK